MQPAANISAAELEAVPISFSFSQPQTENRLRNCGVVFIIPNFSVVHPGLFTHDYIILTTRALSHPFPCEARNSLKSSRQLASVSKCQ